MQNRIPGSAGELLAMAGEMAIGASQYGGTIPLLQITEAILRGAISPLAEAEGAVDQAREELRVRQTAVRNTIRTSKTFLTMARDLIKPEYGSRFNLRWVAAGFNGSTEIPTKEWEVVALLQAMKTFLTNNSSFENPTPGKEVTAVRAGVLFTQLETVQGAVNLQEKLIGDLIKDRDAKAVVVRKTVRDMIAELGIKLSPLDTRWKAFGLNMPGAKPTPPVPLNVTVVLLGGNALLVNWAHSIHAHYYRVWAKVVGVDEELVNIGDTTNLDFTIQGVAAGSQVQIAVSAVSTGGESAKTEIVSVTIPV